jgi:RNA polymerase sigma factor (sigma-70 family)
VETLESPRGYLFRTAINLARDTKRQRRRQGDMSNGGDSPNAEDIPSEAPTAYQVLKGEQELEIIRQAIAELNPTCRQVFILHRFGNATYGQIAERLGVSVSMIEKHVSAALAHLKSRLDNAHACGHSRKALP